MVKKITTTLYGIWCPSPGVLGSTSLRTTRRACIKDYMAWYGVGTKPRLRWAQLYRWGWRTVPVEISFNKPR